ncbi:MAG: FG-GAP repeat domain-containing protein, partial [Desulfuromonadales bacterium]
EYIVDMNDQDNLSIGDILSLVKPGKKILHPQTGEVIGSVDQAIGFLQVTRILSGYSYAKVLTPGLQPENGAQLKRFEQVPASFVTGTDADSNELIRQFKVNLPQLLWLADNQTEYALLTFAMQGNSLEVKTVGGDLLHRYKLTADQQLAVTSPSPRPSVSAPTSTGAQTGPLQKIVTTLMGNVYQKGDEQFAEMDAAIIRQRQTEEGGLWLGPELNGSSWGISVGDFDGDGQQETALVLDNTLLIARINAGKFNQLAEVTIPESLQVLSLDSIDLNGDGRDELYLSAQGNYVVSSFVVEFTGDGYEIVMKNIRWLLRVVDLADGSGRTLLGQRMGHQEKAYINDIFKIEREGDRLVQGPSIELPESLNIFSFVPFLDDRNALNYAHLTDGDYLKVFNQDGVELWNSADYYGGSENCFNIRQEYTNEILIPTCVSSRQVRTPNNQILEVQNDGQRIVERYQKFQRSRIVSLSWNGLSMVENWRTASQNGYLSDFVLADADNDGTAEIVMAVKFKHAGLIDKARSAVVIYELN